MDWFDDLADAESPPTDGAGSSSDFFSGLDLFSALSPLSSSKPQLLVQSSSLDPLKSLRSSSVWKWHGGGGQQRKCWKEKQNGTFC
jgi:hypothetical protein